MAGHGLTVVLTGALSEPSCAVRALPPGFHFVTNSDAVRVSDIHHTYGLEQADERWLLSYRNQPVTAGTEGHVFAVFGGHLMWHAASVGTDHAYLHAGAVSFSGKAHLFPGVSNAGKSTLVVALVARGFGYMSDEYAMIDDIGDVHPFPRRIRFDGVSDADGVVVDATSIGSVEASPLVPAVVVLTSFEPKAQPEVVEELSGGQAVAALLEHCPSMIGSPAASLRRLARLADQARVIRCVRGEAEEFADFFASVILGTSSPHP
ncbi:MAG TPA: hypothetical protein VM345_02440 [Acidimicrobiales bacterium]|nr:hypothetical protein [Acidimicrobiales bacterium]